MRRPHRVKAIKTSEYPQNCIWFDTETYQVQEDRHTVSHWLKFGFACYKRTSHHGKWTQDEWFRFTTRSEFWRWVCAKTREKTRLYLFCHNTSFDLPVLDVFHQLPLHGYSLGSAIIDAPPTILKFRDGSKSLVILDTLNTWRMPLAKLGDEIGLPKLEMPSESASVEEWDAYGRRDVEIMVKACIDWWSMLQAEDLGAFASTLAGQSMNAFKHKYMKHDIFIEDNERSLKLTRAGYYGGRVECFRIGKFRGDFTRVDVNSMYPWCMAEYRYPRKVLTHTRYATVDDLRIWLGQYAIMARVTIETSEPFAPIRQNYKLIFPVGRFECILSSPEIAYALQHHRILAVHEVAVYEHDYLFRDMALDMYAKKQQGRRDGSIVREEFWKKLINSFYGKWGQSGGKWQEHDNVEDLSAKQWIDYDMETRTVTKYRQLGGLVQVKDTETESRESFPAIAAHVTAYARMRLWNLVRQAGMSNVYYCDTDSLLVNPSGHANLADEIDEYKLGGLKIDGKYTDIEIYGAKDYRFGAEEKHKGVRKQATWITTHDISQEQWSSLKGLITRNRFDAPTTKRITKHLTRLYNKGIVSISGIVSPYHLPLVGPVQLNLVDDPAREDLLGESPL